MTTWKLPLAALGLVVVLGLALIAARGFGLWPGANGLSDDWFEAVAMLHPQEPDTTRGTARFSETPEGTRVDISLQGATPGRHGVHLHTQGDCSAPHFSSAGGHYAPGGHPHAGPDAILHHAGDLGNIEVNSSGRGSLHLVTSSLTVKPGDHSVLGRAVIVHARADDLSSQPSGNAGARVACGVVYLDESLS